MKKKKILKYSILGILLISIISLFVYFQVSQSFWDITYDYNKTIAFKNYEAIGFSDYNITTIASNGMCGNSDNPEGVSNTIGIDGGSSLILTNSGSHSGGGCCCSYSMLYPNVLAKTTNLNLTKSNLNITKIYFKANGGCGTENVNGNCGTAEIYLISKSQDILLFTKNMPVVNGGASFEEDNVITIYQNNFGDSFVRYNNKDTLIKLNDNEQYEIAVHSKIQQPTNWFGTSSSLTVEIKDIEVYAKTAPIIPDKKEINYLMYAIITISTILIITMIIILIKRFKGKK